jgi:hypothetical protein
MEEETITKVVKPKVKPQNKIKPVILEEKQVIVHCSIPCEVGMAVRIWKTTFLLSDQGVKIPMLFWDGISLAPKWTPVFKNGFFNFTLIFGGLPSECKVFSMLEEIPEPGGFEVKNIHRNKTDVYHVVI